MDFMELMFNVGPAVKVIFTYGIQPREEDFFELTEEQYQKATEDGVDCSEKMYTWLPTKISYESNELLIMSEEEKNNLIKANKIIDSYCKDKEFKDYDAKLKYVSKILPEVFTEQTKYGQRIEEV